MEEAPLVLAHAHARKAADESIKAHLLSAGSEHDSAAQYYAKAGDDTGDIEALRILALLEEHHYKLAQIVKIKDEFVKRTAAGSTKKKGDAATDDQETADKHVIQQNTGGPASTLEKTTAPSLPKSRSTPSSLAKDMASRRGIPQAQQRRTPNTTTDLSPAGGRMSSDIPKSILGDRRTSETSASESLAAHSRGQSSGLVTASASQAEDGFTRFYANLTTGPLSKLSSMLAYAGLPLTETANEDTASIIKNEKTSARVSTGPDVTQLFSKAALKALEEQKRHPGSAFGPAESFYVIPTSGGTASYANILNKDRSGLARGEDSDEFVDAKEVMTDSDRRNAKQAIDQISPVLRVEELQIENAAMKQILDKLSHRLQAFESHAQDASMAALTQSMASVRAGPSPSGHERDERMRAMEAQLEREMRERERLAQENQRQKQVISKYRSHWEQLKDSARARAKKDKSSDVS